MINRMSTMFVRTLRDDPADAEVPSHRLLVRGGYARRVAPGIYSLLPLGLKIAQQIERVVREEMDAFGAQEVRMPALLPRESYEATGRWGEYGDLLFRLKDRRNNDYLLGPTHEEIITMMVRSEYSSYKDFPVSLYQIQTKYRDEARPRSGILRGREFVMKDSYSFDLDEAGLQKSYDLHRDAYCRIFDRLGIKYKIVSAISGAMGGSKSEEFLAPSASGEDTFVTCSKCEYAANVEAVRVQTPEIANSDMAWPELELLHTPDSPGITALVQTLNKMFANGSDSAQQDSPQRDSSQQDPAQRTSGGRDENRYGSASLPAHYDASKLLKNIIFKLDGKPIMVLVPGDREIDEERLANFLTPAKLEPFDDEDFARNPQMIKGYVAAIGAKDLGIRVYADPRVAPNTSWVTGANKFEHHVRNAVVGRDFYVDEYVDVATVAAGDPCPNCASPLQIDRGIEMGHVFQLGTKYTDAFELDALGPDGKKIRIIMGCYGIGMTRAIGVIAEQNHDQLGLRWNNEIAPAQVHIVVAGKDDQLKVAEDLARQLDELAIRVILDDRDGVSPGVKFKDAELLGMPNIVIVGKGLSQGLVEIRDRLAGTKEDIELAKAVELLGARIKS